ncbi:MAG: hypothetical protein WB791_08400 [Waddliaceae bacterium]
MTIGNPPPVGGSGGTMQPLPVAPEVPPETESADEPGASPFGADSLGAGTGESAGGVLQLAATPLIPLVPGRVSLFEWTKLLEDSRQELRESLLGSRTADFENRRDVYSDIVSSTNQADALHAEALEAAEEGTTPGPWTTFNNLSDAYEDYNTLMTDVAAADQTAIDEVNYWIGIYNTLVEGGQEADDIINDIGGGDVQVVLDMINEGIGAFNAYLAARPDVQGAIDGIIEQTETYNGDLDDLNREIELINEDQGTSYPLLEEVPVPEINPIFNITLDSQLEIPLPLNPTTIEERLSLYVQPLTLPETFDPQALSERIEELQTALLDQAATPEEEALIRDAIEELLQDAINGTAIYANEGEFLTGLRNRMDALAQDPANGVNPNRGLEIFDQGIGDFPIRGIIPNPVPATDEEFGLVTPLEPITGVPGEVTLNNPRTFALETIWLPFQESLLNFLAVFVTFIDLGRLFIDEEIESSPQGYNIIFPAFFLDEVAPVFLQDLSGSGSGVGLTGFVIGLHSNNLEASLSTASLYAVAADSRLPVSMRTYSQLQFTAFELLFRSSLFSAVPAARFLATSLGTQTTTMPMVAVAIALAVGNEITSLINSNVIRALVNGTISRLSFGIRIARRQALEGVVRAERLLNLAIATGNPGFIRFALSQVVHAHLRLASVNRLFNTFGLTTIGGFSAMTLATAATLNLAILSIALAQFGRAIGLPAIVPQMFANFPQISTLDALVFLTAGSRIMDVLDNPISMLFIKQTLLNILIFRGEFPDAAAGINRAINAVISRGGINSFSHLQAELVAEFQRSGFNFFIAHLLANETVALIRGSLGVQFLNVAFGLNFDPSVISSSIVNNIYGFDVGVAGTMLSNAIVRALLMGGFGTRVRLVSDLRELFQTLGLNEADATVLANQTVDFLETVGVLIPFNRYSSAAELILGTIMERAVIFGTEFDREAFIEELQNRGLSEEQAILVADFLEQLIERSFVPPGNLFELAIEEAINRAVRVEGTETQREFRDHAVGELRAVGFSRSDANFLGTSAAGFAIDGTVPPYLGVDAARADAINGSLTDRGARTFGISSTDSAQMVGSAQARARERAPFTSEDDYSTALREAFTAEAARAGHANGHIVFDQSIAGLADPTARLSLDQLTKDVDKRVAGIFGPNATEQRDAIFQGVFGGTTIDAIENEEERNPLSIFHQSQKQLDDIEDRETQELSERASRRTKDQILADSVPNAVSGWVNQTIMDSIQPFLGHLDMNPRTPEIDIPV